MALHVLHNGQPVTDITPGGTPAYVPGFALVPAPAMTVQGLPGDWLQWREDGVDVGDANPVIVDFVGDPSRILATRGVGENSHVITVRMAPTVLALVAWRAFESVFNPGGLLTVTLAGDHLQDAIFSAVTNQANCNVVGDTRDITSGKYYFEVTVTRDTSAFQSGAGFLGVAVANSSWVGTDIPPVDTDPNIGTTACRWVGFGNGAPLVPGQRYGVLCDFDALTVTYYRGGVSFAEPGSETLVACVKCAPWMTYAQPLGVAKPATFTLYTGASELLFLPPGAFPWSDVG